jgi:2-amino-4-hydroxy-6-hydroxymethyldihydropteridine diphosphokinase
MELCERIVISVGSNCQREVHFTQAFDALHRCFGELLFSPVYESQPLHDMADSENYYNAVLVFFTSKSLKKVRAILQDIEVQCGRDRTQVSVTIDLDLLLYGEISMVDNGVVLPHPSIVECAYVLRPLADCLPSDCHPIVGDTYSHLWHLFCDDNKGKQLLFPVDFVWQGQLISVSAPCLAI